MEKKIEDRIELYSAIYLKAFEKAGFGTKFLYSLRLRNENTQTLFCAPFHFNT